jgi:hypothetical protein
VHEPVIVNSSTFPEPAQLATCKEIRDEALDILYAEYSFETDIQDYDSTPLMAMHAIMPILRRLRSKGPTNITMLVQGQPNWKNSETWLERVHTGYIPLVPGAASIHANSPNHKLIQNIHEIAIALGDLPWSRVKDSICEMRQPLAILDNRWRV